MTLQQFALGIETIPAATCWYLADLGEARGKQELFTRQSPQKLKVLRENALIESAVSSNRIEGVEARLPRLARGAARSMALRELRPLYLEDCIRRARATDDTTEEPSWSQDCAGRSCHRRISRRVHPQRIGACMPGRQPGYGAAGSARPSESQEGRLFGEGSRRDVAKRGYYP